MDYPYINEHQMVRISNGLCDKMSIDDFDPPLTEAERWWYKELKEDREKFEREHPGVQPIWEIPFDCE